MPSQEIKMRSLGSRGIITDLDEYHIPSDAFSAAENLVVRDGVPTNIGRIPRSGDGYVGSGGFFLTTTKIGGVLSRNTNGSTLTCERNLSAWRLGTHDWYAGGGSVYTDELSGEGPYLPLIDYNGESLWFDQSGRTPILRWSESNKGDDDIVALSASPSEGDRIFTYATGNGRLGYYVGFYSANEIIPQAYRIVRAPSTTSFETEDPYDGPTSAIGYVHNEHGYLGLSVLVREVVASWASDVLTAATNNSFTAAMDGVTQAVAGDQIVAKDSGSQVSQVVDVTSSTTIDTLSGISLPAGPTTFRIIRPLVGTCGALHRGRLYVAGASWMPNRVFISPQGYRFSDAYNGIDSPNTDKGNARLAKFLDVPSDRLSGKIVALLSTSGPLLVLRDVGAYYLHGEYPNNSVNLLPGIDGCLDVRAAIQTRYGQVIAGRDGIYLHNNGGVRDITANRRKDEWRRLVETMYRMPTGAEVLAPVTACAMIGRYLFVSISRNTRVSGSWDNLQRDDGATWVYDMETGNWQGNVPALHSFAFSIPGDYSDSETFRSDTLAWADPDDGYGLYRIRDLEMADQADVNNDTTAEPGLMFETGPITGIGENDRLTNVKVTYEMEAAAAATATLRVSTDHGDGFETTQNFTTDDSGNGPITKRTNRTFLSATAGGLGVTGNRVRVKVEDATTSGNLINMRVHGLSAIVRRRLRRA